MTRRGYVKTYVALFAIFWVSALVYSGIPSDNWLKTQTHIVTQR